MKSLEKEGYKTAPSAYFTDKVFLKVLVAANTITDCNVSNVVFEAGSRNNWHTHPSNQILIIKEGTCLYQEDGKSIQRFNAGEAINILPGINTGMVHLGKHP